MNFKEKDWIKLHNGTIGRVNSSDYSTVVVKFFTPNSDYVYMSVDEATNFLTHIDKDDLIEILFEEIVDLK